MISIKQIDFENYRIAGTCTLSFADPDNGYHMYGIIAENGTGKTTILNAITWCLYGEEYQLKDSETALSIINSKKLNEMKMDESAVVSVGLTIQDGDKELVFRRRHKVIRSQMDDGTPQPIPDTQSDFVVVESDISNAESAKSYINEDAKYRVAEYFENTIHDFFFFDGEKLEEFFTNTKAASIQQSIEAIAQISLLDAVIRNAGEISSKMSSRVSKNHPAVKRLELEMEKAKEDLDESEKHFKKLNEQVGAKEDEKKKVDAILHKNDLSASYQSQKKLLSEKMNDIQAKQEALYKKKVRLAVRSMTLAHVYPQIESALKLIEEKGESGDYSVLLSTTQLRALLNDAVNHAANCPVCGSGIQTAQMLHIQNIISRQTVDDDIALTLRTLKEDLQSAKEEFLRFKEEYKDILDSEKELVDAYDESDKEYKTVSANLARLGTARDEEGNEIDFEKLEGMSRDLKSAIQTLYRSIGASESEVNTNRDAYNRKCIEYADAVKQENDDKDLQDVIDTLKMVTTNLTRVKTDITREVRTKLETITSEIFMRVVKKQETFGGISISDSYRLSLYDKYGQEMTGSASATEYMILAYAYTLAIHEASGHNCPLVIDSPLGRVSGEVRANTADMLLETSRDKQIIMLFTEDEYSESVKNLFNGKATMRTISLTEDEKTWEDLMV